MTKRTFPEHIGPSRAWKTRKRREAAALERALDAFLVGCFFTPCKDVGLIRTQVREWREQLSVKAWGR